jgi:hypothetical protein
MPALEIVRLPNDHTSGASAGVPTPRAFVADNDLALGRMIEALSKSPFWKNTAVFVLEDDAQNGPDHVDSHRSPLLVISPWVRAGLVHRFANTTDVLRTIEELLGLDALSQFEHYGRPLRDIWSDTPDARVSHQLGPRTAFVDRDLQPGERRRQLLFEKGSRPRLGKGAPLDLQHRGKVRVVHRSQGDRVQAVLLAFGKTTSRVLSR